MKLRVLHARFQRRIICMFLAVTMAIGPSLNVIAQSPAIPPAKSAAPAPESVAAAGGTIDTTYVAPNAAAIVVLRPAQIMKSALAEMLPVEVATAAGLKYLGVDPANVEEATAFADLSNPMAPAYGITLKFVAPIRGSDINEQLRAHTQRDQLAGKAYLKSQHPLLPSFFALNGQTLIAAPDEVLRRLVERPVGSKPGPLVERVGKVTGGNDLYAAINLTPLRPLMQIGLAQSRQPLPPETKPFMDALDLLDSAELTLNLSRAGTTSLIAHANDDAAATQIEKLLTNVAAKYREQMTAQLAKQRDSEDPVERAAAQYAERISGRWTQPFMPQREGADLVIFRADGSNSQQQQLVTVAVIGVLVALLLPAVQAAREAARRNASMVNLKEISIAYQNNLDTRKSFPAHAIYGADGKPLLSWRVAILPFLDEQELYEQFHRDEPWDSEHNRALIARMPRVYQNPNLAEPGKTNYLAIVGKECVFDGTAKGAPISKIIDGTSMTILVAEADADRAVEWTKPEDLKYDSTNPTAGLGRLRPGGWLAGFADAHISFIANAIDRQTLNALFTCAGREAIPAAAQ